MKSYIERTPFADNGFRAVVRQDNQYFTIAEGDGDHCRFISNMFREALKHHDAAVAQSAERLPCKQGVEGSNPSGGSKPALSIDYKAIWEEIMNEMEMCIPSAFLRKNNHDDK